MEVKNGEKTISIPGWVVAAGIATVGTIVADICKTIGMKRKQVSRTKKKGGLGQMTGLFSFCQKGERK